MSWQQKTIQLKPRSRGFHIIDDELLRQLPEIAQYKVGLLHLFIQHTSASLTINENADPTVRMDMESHFNKFVPERQSYYKHDYEGDDDMPAHIKSALTNTNLTLSIINKKLILGVWQGIFLFEHRFTKRKRNLILHCIGN